MGNRRKLCYLRVSQEDLQAEGESASIASQRLCIRQYLEARPALGDPAAYEELVDDGYSGTSFDRPGMTRLLQLVQAGEVETVIVRDLSRFGRNYLEAGRLLELVFPAYDVRFLSIQDRFDTGALGETTAGFGLAVRNLINQLYSRDISRKIKSAVDLQKRRGEYVYGAAPYGYRKGAKRNTIEPDPPAAAVVRDIFGWAAAGVTVTGIAARLNEAGVPTPSAYLQPVRGRYPVRPFWTYHSVRNILENRIYTGDTVPFRSRVAAVGSKRVRRIPEAEQIVLPDTHEAIVSRETYQKARQVIRSRPKSAPRKSGGLLDSYVVCGCCGNRLYKGRAQNRTYRCPTARYAPHAGCAAVRIEKDALEALLLRALQSQCAAADPETARPAQRDALSRQAALRGALREEKRKLDQSRQARVRLYEAYAGGTLDRAAFLRESEAERQAGAAAADRAATLTEALRRQEEEADRTADALRRAGALRGVETLTPALLGALLRRVTVQPGGAVEIAWSFQDPFAPSV